ncbi:MAG: 1-phosphofructokinase [Lachnospiraceae bacterium]|jgi:1-phosphofructokinase|nr:1-phosphofructokinase [Lachnospiraceae bacterium]
MIVTITLNPCMDKTIYLDQLSIGSYNRVQNTRSDLSGKGINVSTALSHFRAKTHCMGLNFRGNAQMLERILDQRGLSHDFVLTDGQIRTNIKLFDKSFQVMTEINEAGPTVPSRAVDLLLDKIEGILDQAYLLVLSGSIPPGVPTDIYQRIIRMAHRKDVKTVLDAAGEPFLLGLSEKPYLIKPNLYEFGQAFQEEIKAGKEPLEIARGLVRNGIPYICISMGSDGALLIDKDHTYRAAPLSVEAKGLTGAGDSMVAGMCYAIRRRLSSEDMLRYAMAASAGSVRLEGTLLASWKDVEELLPQVEIQVL